MGDNNGNTNSAADSYIGSLISLTSKSEIRYEGILYSVDTGKSNIALQDVRSFGTEGRKKDGPQIPPSDKVYDYIIFRGTDIKDLQVKSSPPARPVHLQQAHHDPAIVSLQTQASPMAPPLPSGSISLSTASTPTASAGTTSTDGSNRMPYPSIPSAAYPSSMSSLYPPHAGLGSWQQIPPGTNGAMANMPMYWPGFYRPPYLPQPPYQLPPMMPSNYASHSPSPVPPHQLLASQASLPTSSSAPSPSTVSAGLAQSEVVSLESPTVVSSADTTLSDTLLASISSASQMPTLLHHVTSATAPEERGFIALSNTQAASNVTASTVSKPQCTDASESNNVQRIISNKVEFSKSLADRSLPLLSEHAVTERSATREPLISVASSAQVQSSGDRPLLPLPVDSLRHVHTLQASGHSRYMHRGRGRGRGIRNHVSHSELMEEFDFTAMNEKFKKDEVWGELGKDLKERVEVEEDAYEDTNEEDNVSKAMPVYVKDDFFDSLSCDTLGRGQVERNKFSDQQKIDVETFGRYTLRSHGVRGGRGGFRGGYRGGYYGGRAPANGSRGRFHPRNYGGY